MAKSLVGILGSTVQLCCVTITLAGLPAVAPAQTGGGFSGSWQLYTVSTGQNLGVYATAAACIQATATQPSGTLSCKPIYGGSAPTPTAPTGVHPGLQVDPSTLPDGSAGYANDRLLPTSQIAPLTDVGAFRTTCAFSHMAYDDPIVSPGRPGAAHLHTFFGNTGTNAASTAESIRSTGNSTCRGGTINRSAYWVPTMVDTATQRAVAPAYANFYYKQGYALNPPSIIKALPAGLRMIAGNAQNAAPGARDASFHCFGGPNHSNDQYGSSIPNCDVGAQVVQSIHFPQCWDGRNLDSPGHKSHMSYPVRQTSWPYLFSCPSSHPVAIPEISFNIAYMVPTRDAARNWRLSSDVYDRSLPGGYSSHGDWFNGWKKDVSDIWNAACVQTRRDCFSHLLGDGRMTY